MVVTDMAVERRLVVVPVRARLAVVPGAVRARRRPVIDGRVVVGIRLRVMMVPMPVSTMLLVAVVIVVIVPAPLVVMTAAAVVFPIVSIRESWWRSHQESGAEQARGARDVRGAQPGRKAHEASWVDGPTADFRREREMPGTTPAPALGRDRLDATGGPSTRVIDGSITQRIRHFA